MRASLSLKSVTEHLKALETEGWIRSKRGNARLGQTTTRWVDVRRVLAESSKAVLAYRERIEARLGEESTPDPLQLALGEDDGNDQVKLVNDQVKLGTLSGEAASLETVIDPSDQQSYEPSEARARDADVPATGKGKVSERTDPPLPPEASARGGSGRLSFFGQELSRCLRSSEVAQLGELAIEEAPEHIVLFVPNEEVRHQLETGALSRTIRACAQAAGYKGFLLKDRVA